jgi:hypothetical protein
LTAITSREKLPKDGGGKNGASCSFPYDRAGILGLAESASMASVDELFKLPFELHGHIPAFVILLESDQERYFHVHRDVLPKLPICNIIKATNAEKKEVEHFLREKKIDIDTIYTPITLGKLACTISHIRTWKAILAQDLKHAIVLEDDVAIRDGFIFFIRKLITQLPINFDLVHLYVSAHRSEWLRHASDRGAPTLKKRKTLDTTCTRKQAQAIILAPPRWLAESKLRFRNDIASRDLPKGKTWLCRRDP